MPTVQLHRIQDSEVLIQKIKTMWMQFHNIELSSERLSHVINTSLLERLTSDKHTLFIILDAPRLEFIYVGSNVDRIFGYTHQEILEQQFNLILKIIPRHQIQFFEKILHWGQIVRDEIPFEAKQAYMTYIVCGLMLQRKDGSMLKSMCRVYPIELTTCGFVNIAMIELIDVTNLLKSDDYWVHVTAGVHRNHVLTFYSNKSNHYKHDLISQRERDVLLLLANGKSTKEIADALYISTNTVEKHKKNMLSRLGARDSVALTEICKRCNII